MSTVVIQMSRGTEALHKAGHVPDPLQNHSYSLRQVSESESPRKARGPPEGTVLSSVGRGGRKGTSFSD